MTKGLPKQSFFCLFQSAGSMIAAATEDDNDCKNNYPSAVVVKDVA